MNPNPALDVDRETGIAYLQSLKEGDEVIDCSNSAMYMTRGVVYFNNDGIRCVRWTLGENWGDSSGKQMGTSVTWGTRKIKDANLT